MSNHHKNWCDDCWHCIGSTAVLDIVVCDCFDSFFLWSQFSTDMLPNTKYTDNRVIITILVVAIYCTAQLRPQHMKSLWMMVLLAFSTGHKISTFKLPSTLVRDEQSSQHQFDNCLHCLLVSVYCNQLCPVIFANFFAWTAFTTMVCFLCCPTQVTQPRHQQSSQYSM